MALFGSRRKITVFSAAAHLMQPDDTLIQDAVLYGVLKRKSISAAIVDAHLQSIGTKMDAALRYAENTYTLGLPNQYHGSSNLLSDTEIADIITTDLSLPYGCLVDFNLLVSMDAITATLPYLMATREFNPFNTHVLNPPVWSEGIGNKYAGQFISRTYNVTEVTLAADNVTVEITYYLHLTYQFLIEHEWVQQVVPTSRYQHTYTETTTLPAALQIGRLYYVAGYRELDSEEVASTTTEWWYYSIDSGKYPELDPNNSIDERPDAYPVIPIRYNNEYISGTNSPDIYDTGSNLLRRMGLNFDDIVDKLDENPDVADMDHAYVMLGVDLQTDNQIALGYLIDFFTYLSESDDLTIWDALAGSGITNTNFFSTSPYVNASGSTSTTEAETTIINPVDSMSLTEHGLNINITYETITSVLVVGSIGDIGQVVKTLTASHTVQNVVEEESVLTLQKQVAANTYREVKVTGLIHTNAIYNNHSIITTIDDIIASVDEHNFIIPLHRTVAQRYGLEDRNVLYHEAMVLVINSYDITRLKWYETSAFMAAFTIVTIVLTIVTAQPWVIGLSQAAQAGAGALILYLLKSAVIAAAVHYGTVAIAKKFGPDVAIVVALITTAAAAVTPKGMTFTAFGSTIPTAEAFMFLGSITLQSSNKAMNLLIQDVDAEYQEFMVDAEAQAEILKAKEDLLDKEYHIPFSYLQPSLYPEPDTATKPDRFYDKIHVGNIGTLSLNVIENYVDTALLLPEGDIFN